MEIFGVPSALLGSQLLVGLINGSFYAILSLGLAIIFGLLNIINFTHGAQYMMGAFVAWIALNKLGINVPLLITFTYGFGVALAAFAGVLAAPIYQVSPLMGSNLIIVVFAVVVIGGMGSIMGSILTGLGLGLIEGLTRVFYPEASAVVVFVIMVIVLLVRPAGLFGKA